MRDLYTDIKLHGHQYLPWRDAIVAPNVSNKKDEPWHLAKKEIISRLPGTPLEKLPQVGRLQAKGLREFGFEYVEDLLCERRHELPFRSTGGHWSEGRGTHPGCVAGE